MPARLIFLLLAAGAAAQPPKLDIVALERAATEEMAAAGVPGAAIGLVSGGKLVWSKGLGVSSVESGAPVTPDMLFRLGSTTKMFTAAAVVSLALEDKLRLGDPAGKHIHGLPPRLAGLTPHQLLTHTAGLRDEAPMHGSHDEESLGRGIRAWDESWLFTAPGKIYSYSNPGYWMAGYLAEVVAGKPYADVLAERVFQPAGMSRTTLRPLVAITYPMAQGHNADGGGSPVVVRPAADNTATWPAGSIFSSVSDLARFVSALMNGGRIDDKPALPADLVTQLMTPRVEDRRLNVRYGYGLSIDEDRGARLVGHGGSRMGYGSLIRMAPEHRAAVIVVANRTGASLARTAGLALRMLVPMPPETKPEPQAGMPIAESDFPKFTAVYANGPSRIEIVAEGGKLMVSRLGGKAPLVWHGGDRYSIGSSEGPQNAVFVPAADGRIEYIFRGGRALARQ